jgi:hypothetical protein
MFFSWNLLAGFSKEFKFSDANRRLWGGLLIEPL